MHWTRRVWDPGIFYYNPEKLWQWLVQGFGGFFWSELQQWGHIWVQFFAVLRWNCLVWSPFPVANMGTSKMYIIRPEGAVLIPGLNRDLAVIDFEFCYTPVPSPCREFIWQPYQLSLVSEIQEEKESSPYARILDWNFADAYTSVYRV